jgi:4-amino-4-deoxy-L-arabinose transferase-like glycosyltransferase
MQRGGAFRYIHPPVSRSRAIRLLLAAVSSPVTIVAVALILRVIVAHQLISTFGIKAYRFHIETSRIAEAIAHGDGFSSPYPGTSIAPTAQQPPVYPFLLAGIFKLFGIYSMTSLWVAMLLNAVLSSVTAALVLRMGKTLLHSPAGVLASWAWAGSLQVIAVSLRLWETTLSALILALGVLLAHRMAKSGKRWQWVLFGALTGAGALTNTTLTLSFLILAGLASYHLRADGGRAGGRFLAMLAVFLLTLCPWTIRNWQVFHSLFLVRDNLGMELWIGNRTGMQGIADFSGDFPLTNPAEYNRLGELAFMQAKGREASEFILRHPVLFLLRSTLRAVSYWSAPEPLTWLPISALAWAGLVLAVRRKTEPKLLREPAIWLAIPILFFPLVYYMTHPWSTYRHVIEPMIFLFACYTLTRVFQAIATSGTNLWAPKTGPSKIAGGSL